MTVETLMPNSKRKVRLLRKAQVEEIAARLGIELAPDAEHRTTKLRELITAHLEL